jgi:hypothetical protein
MQGGTYQRLQDGNDARTRKGVIHQSNLLVVQLVGEVVPQFVIDH